MNSFVYVILLFSAIISFFSAIISIKYYVDISKRRVELLRLLKIESDLDE